MVDCDGDGGLILCWMGCGFIGGRGDVNKPDGGCMWAGRGSS